MDRDIIIIVFTSVATIASILTIINSFKIKEVKTRLAVSISIAVIFLVAYLYIVHGIRQINLPPLPPQSVADIEGSYTGYFIDELGTRIPTYLLVEYDDVSDSVKLIFKNDHTNICNAEYLIAEGWLIIDKLENGRISEDNGKVIIESLGNIKNNWKFIKDNIN